ncbi:glycosyltransferase family 9 protein [Candidatus Babeliales bacterium]|nr:glycosyltransferase family 9 protein [Candidatus Babeliales bacterium]MCF7899619.1 glycosyltransferase family 9 protein [Candidatus Babeliales bacterium]
MNILILRVSSIGDVIHTLPAIFLIKKLNPHAKISWIVQEKAACILKDQDFLENVWVIPDKFLKIQKWPETIKIIKEIKKYKWDAILDFQGIMKTSIFLFFLKGPKYGFDYKNSRMGLTSYFTTDQMTPEYKNIIQKNLALTSYMLKKYNKNNYIQTPNIESLKKDFRLNISEERKTAVKNWLKKNNIKKFIALTPNTTWTSKEWPTENWKYLFDYLNKINKYSIVLIGKDFGKQAYELSKDIKEKNLNFFIAPNWNLLTTSYLISKTELFIAPDTGLLHMADFLNKKTIGIFGPTLVKKHGPFFNQANIKNAIQIKCSYLYKRSHTKNKFIKNKNCMYNLTPENLFVKIKQILNFG